MARIAVGGFMHESNSFVPGHTDYDKYASGTTDRPPLSRGNELFERLSDISCSSAGFVLPAKPVTSSCPRCGPARCGAAGDR